MKTGKSIVWGVFLIIIGVILGAHELGFLNFNIFFDGWWTLFIIIPSFIGLFTDDNKVASFTFLIIGALLLLACQEIIDFDLIAKLIVPIIIVMIGISLLFKNTFNKEISEKIENVSTKAKGEYNAIFSGQDIKLDKEEFEGTKLNALFGGIKLDLRNAIIKNDVVITSSAIFGGIDIYVPNNVKVEIKSNSIFGGIDDKSKTEKEDIKIYIDATCIFGGIEIK